MAIHDAAPPGLSSSAVPPSSHRLPTVSASQALDDLANSAPTPLRTGLSQLDTLLSDHISKGATNAIHLSPIGPGLPPGSLVEIWGPSGSGKTTLTMTLAASALKAGNGVIWLDLSTPLVLHRLRSVLGHAATEGDDSAFHHLSLPSLSHLLALLQDPPTHFPWSAQSLLVVENLHHVLDVAYPRVSPFGKSEQARWLATRRSAVLGTIAALLHRLIAVHAIATAVVTSNATTRSRGPAGTGAVLAPALGGLEWDRTLAARWVLFRDFADDRQEGKQSNSLDWGRPRRFLGVTKLGTRAITDEDGDVGVVIQFDIDETGIVDLAQSQGLEALQETDGVDTSYDDKTNDTLPTRMVSPSHTRPPKRHHDEIADSESDGEYGWNDGDGEEVLVAAEGLIDEDALFAAVAPDAVSAVVTETGTDGVEQTEPGNGFMATVEADRRRHTG